MTQDARFEDARVSALRLSAETGDDLQVISSLCQDAVFPVSEMTYQSKDRRFAILLNRFRWELGTEMHPAQRVQAVLTVDAVTAVKTSGIDRKDADMVLSLLSIDLIEEGDDVQLILNLAGDGAIAVHAECLALSLKDVTKPYFAPSGKTPSHKLD